MVLVPLCTTWIAWQEKVDWFTFSLAVVAGLAWTGVLLPTPVRHSVVLFSGGMAAVCGALVSITFSYGLEHGGKLDQTFMTTFLGLVAAGTASMYGRHRNAVEQRASE